jgi:hypothetical protein
MSNTLTTSTTTCNHCLNPIEYLFELIYQSSLADGDILTILFRTLEKGIAIPSCNTCCPTCDDLYFIGGLNKLENLFESVPAESFSNCCLNYFTSVETFVSYAEAVGLTGGNPVPALNNSQLPYLCCNGFTECIEDLFCLISRNAAVAQNNIDRLLDKGIFEIGGLSNNCGNAAFTSQLCTIVEIFKKYFSFLNGDAITQIFEEILDNGIYVICHKESGLTFIFGSDRFPQYLEFASPSIPALS